MPHHRTAKLVAAAMAASALASSWLPSHGFSVLPRFRPCPATRLHLLKDDSQFPDFVQSPSAAQEEAWHRTIHAYLTATYQDYRAATLDSLADVAQQVDHSEADMRKFKYDPEARFAEATYRYATCKTHSTVREDDSDVVHRWQEAVEDYHTLLHHLHLGVQLDKLQLMTVMARLSLASEELLATLRYQYGGFFDERIHPQQWLDLSTRLYHALAVDQQRQLAPPPLQAYPQISPVWNTRAPPVATKSLMNDPEFQPMCERYKELDIKFFEGHFFSFDNMIERSLLMTKLVFFAEPWLNAQKDQNVIRFEHPQTYPKTPDMPTTEPKSLFRFPKQEYHEEHTKTSKGSRPILSFDHTPEETGPTR